MTTLPWRILLCGAFSFSALFGQSRPTGTEYYTIYASGGKVYGQSSLETSSMQIPPGTSVIHTVTAKFGLSLNAGSKTWFSTVQSGGPQNSYDPVATGFIDVDGAGDYFLTLDDTAVCNYFGPFFSDTAVETYVLAAPEITEVTPSTIYYGSSAVPLEIDGTNFGSSPVVNFPAGWTVTLGVQSSTDTQIQTQVNIPTNYIGITYITVTADSGLQSNYAEMIIDGPYSMQYTKYDEFTTCNGCKTTMERDVGYQVYNFTGSTPGNISVCEMPVITNWNCQQAQGASAA